MVLIISKFTFIFILVGHDLFTLESAVILPLTYEFATVGPIHFALSISFVEFPITVKQSLLVVHNILVVLIKLHDSFPAPLAIFEIAYIMVTSDIFYLTVSIESTLVKVTMQLIVVGILFAFEYVTHRVLEFTTDDLVVLEFSREMCVVVLETKIEKLSFTMSHIIFPFPFILDL